MADTASPSPAPAPATGITLWSADVLARQLVSDDPLVRTVALGMAVQPEAPIAQCVQQLVEGARLAAGDALASQLAATALGCLPPPSADDAVYARLAAFVAQDQATPVRIAAAHAMFRLGCLPPAGHDGLATMLLDDDANARKVALLAVAPLATTAAGALARHIAATPPSKWTMEALQALVRSAGEDSASRAKIEGYVMRSLAGAPLLPTGVAAYALLARLNPGGPAIAALAKIAGDAGQHDASNAALEALGELGEGARSAARELARMLAETDDPAREELLCRTLVRLRSPAGDLPIARVLQRVQGAPDRSTAAHCMLLCLHPKEFGQAAAIVQHRFAAAGDALKHALAQTYKTLTGNELASGSAAGKA